MGLYAECILGQAAHAGQSAPAAQKPDHAPERGQNKEKQTNALEITSPGKRRGIYSGLRLIKRAGIRPGKLPGHSAAPETFGDA